MMLTYLPDPSVFLEEVKRWGVTSESRHRVRAMQTEDTYWFRFAIPNSSEVIETSMPKSEYTRFGFTELGLIITPSLWKDEITQLKNIAKKLEELNANATFSRFNRSEDIRRNLEFT